MSKGHPRYDTIAGNVQTLGATDLVDLLFFHDLPLEHWLQRRTAVPIESIYVGTSLRTNLTTQGYAYVFRRGPFCFMIRHFFRDLPTIFPY